jgi:hypothetical protein
MPIGHPTHPHGPGPAYRGTVVAPDAFESRSVAATAQGAQAYARLLHLAEHHDSGQSRRLVRFIAAPYDGDTFPFDPYELRAVDLPISDDMLACLDALRWARADLHRLLPNGDARARALVQRWGLVWPEGD